MSQKTNIIENTRKESLTTKVIKGGGWMLLTRLVTRLVGVGVSMVLARLLSPNAYGLVAVGTLTISLLQVFTEVGFQQSLIQEAEDIEPLIGTTWTVGVLRGIVISAVMVLLAPWIAKFFGLSEAVSIVRVLSLHPLIYSLTNIHIVYFKKRLEFFKQFLYEVSALVGTLIVGVGLALLWQNTWALVASQLASVTIQVIISYVLFPTFPTIEIDWSHVQKLYRFGKWVFLGGIVSYFSMKGDTYFVGRFFDEKMLGLYTMAYRIANLPVDELKSTLARVLFPAYAKIQDSPEQLNQAFLSAYELLSIIMLPASVGVALVAPDFVLVFLGDKWIDMIPLLRILGFGAAVRSLMVASSGFAWGIGKPKINFYQSFARGGLLLILLLFLPKYWGVIGIGYAVLFSNILDFIVGVYYITSLVGIDLFNWMLRLVPIGVSVLIMTICVFVLHSLLEPGLFRLTLSCFTGGITYIGSVVLFGYLLGSSSIDYLVGWLKYVRNNKVGISGL